MNRTRGCHRTGTLVIHTSVCQLLAVVGPSVAGRLPHQVRAYTPMNMTRGCHRTDTLVMHTLGTNL